MNNFEKITAAGQSIWYDNIQRRMLNNGELEGMIKAGEIRGVTSNPSIFNQAIGKSSDYDAALKPMAWANWEAEKIFFQLAVEDIRAAADLFRPLYDETNGGDGYVSLEVSPFLADNANKTLSQAMELWTWVDRPNLMVKIPATKAGLPAIRKAIAAGLNINVTLIFSLERYIEVMDAYQSGLEDRVAKGLPIDRIASVASFFVSRVDTKVDTQLKEIPQTGEIKNLYGKAAIANARLAYDLFLKEIAKPRWKALQAKGARLQRPLWASTSTKNPSYRDVIYVEELIGSDTVNTVPPQTLDAFREHGEVKTSISGQAEEAKAILEKFAKAGIKMDEITQSLEEEGVKSFADAFSALLTTIEERKSAARKELGSLARPVALRVAELDKSNALQRLHQPDPSLWTDDPAGQQEILKRVGWLRAPQFSRKYLPELESLRRECQSAGYTHALLLGMGGSSLAPEVMALTFGPREISGALGLDLAILDSTDPIQVRAAALRSPVEKTLFIVSSKSGTTSEVNAYFDYFWKRVVKRAGKRAGDHFIAITDPNTSLEKLAHEHGFRRVFQADPNVGGRNSALTAFGLVPAALLGIDLDRFLARADEMVRQCSVESATGSNPGIVFGAVIGEAALAGRNKLTILTDPEWSAFGSWCEQLIAESSGKNGKGILPVDIEPIVSTRHYGKDRLFVYIRRSGEMDKTIQKLRRAGHPVIAFQVSDEYDLASQFYLWEIATAIACSVLRVNSFDQPDVQDNKTRTQNKIAEFKEQRFFAEGNPLVEIDGDKVYGKSISGIQKLKTLREVVDLFVEQASEGDYIAINAYVPRNSRTLANLQRLRKRLLLKTSKATTLGFGPRFLHSTGQLHKGGPDSGLFIQITCDEKADFDIPGEGITFGTLERAQALGDFEALQARNRRVIRIHLEDGDIRKLL